MAEYKSQYQFSLTYKTRERAEEALEYSYADGEVSAWQEPEVKAIKDHRGRVQGYAIFLTECHYY